MKHAVLALGLVGCTAVTDFDQFTFQDGARVLELPDGAVPEPDAASAWAAGDAGSLPRDASSGSPDARVPPLEPDAAMGLEDAGTPPPPPPPPPPDAGPPSLGNHTIDELYGCSTGRVCSDQAGTTRRYVRTLASDARCPADITVRTGGRNAESCYENSGCSFVFDDAYARGLPADFEPVFRLDNTVQLRGHPGVWTVYRGLLCKYEDA